MSDFADPTGSKLYIATPCYGQLVHCAYTQAALGTQALLTEQGISCRVDFQARASIPHARNNMVARFMASPDTHLLFIDADIGWQPESVLRLLSAACLEDHEVVCGAYAMKTPPPLTLTVNFPITQDDNVYVHPVSNFWEVWTVGAGFLMIRRSAIEKMIAAYPERNYHTNPERMRVGATPYLRDGTQYTFFDCFIEGERYLTEDAAFCHLWRQLGERIWLDPWCELSHYGMHEHKAKPPIVCFAHKLVGLADACSKDGR
jgi:hypothetical protein